jgi:hypothetical protein
MARISQEAKKQYDERVRAYKDQIEAIQHRESTIRSDIEHESAGSGYKRITLADERLNLASYFLLLNRVSLAVLGTKQEKHLDSARKCCYQSIIYLEEVVGDQIDAPFSEYAERLEQIDGFPDESRHVLARKMGYTIQSVRDDYGENNKFRWSFVDIEGRFAAVTKNLVNLKTLIAGLDPRVDGYEVRLEHLNLIKELLRNSADQYREKFELATNRIDDFRKAISFLLALKRIHILLGETPQAEDVRKRAEVWTNRLEELDQEQQRQSKQKSN